VVGRRVTLWPTLYSNNNTDAMFTIAGVLCCNMLVASAVGPICLTFCLLDLTANVHSHVYIFPRINNSQRVKIEE